MKNTLILVFFLFNIQIVFSQNHFAAEKEKVTQLLKSASELEYTNWDKAQVLIDKAEQIAERSNDKELKVWFRADAAFIYYDRDIFDISLKYSLDAYHYFKGKDDAKALASENLVAIIYARMNNQKEALKYFMNYYNEIKNKDRYLSAKALNNIGNLYLSSGRQDSAYYYFKRAIDQLDHTTDKRLEVMINTNLGRTMASTNTEKAENHFLYAAQLSQSIDDPTIKCVLYSNLSEFYLKTGKPALAVKYAEEAKKYSKVKYSFQNQSVLKSLYKSYLAVGKPQKSAEYFQIYDQIRDSLNIEEKAVNIEREKIQYAFKDKEKEIQLINNQKRLNLVYAILVLLVVLATSLIFLIRYKNTLEKEKLGSDLSQARENELKLALELRNKELVTKAILENERSSIYQQLKDDLIKIKNLESTEELRKEINAVIFRLVKNPTKTYWEEFELRFNNVYDSFYEKLQQKHPNLSHNDKKLCALIKLNLSSKDIAAITQTSLKSVENSRTRLRKKLDLTHSNTELHLYLSSL